MFYLRNIFLVVCVASISIAEIRPSLSEAFALLKNEKYIEATDAFTSFIPIDGRGPFSDQNVVFEGHEIKLSLIYSSRARCWFRREEYEKAKNDYIKAYQLNSNPENLRRIAECMYELGEYAGAIGKYDKYLTTKNLDREGEYLARYYKSFSVFKSGCRDQAIYDLEMLKVEFPEMSNSVQRTVDQFEDEKYRIDNLDQIIRDLERLQAKYPETGHLLQPKIDKYKKEQEEGPVNMKGEKRKKGSEKGSANEF
jgi:tetratricopeptide (TPR) repeat protein